MDLRVVPVMLGSSKESMSTGTYPIETKNETETEIETRKNFPNSPRESFLSMNAILCSKILLTRCSAFEFCAI